MNTPYWHPARHADRRGFLHGRARIIAAIRGHFAAEGFIEVEPTALVESPGGETQLHALKVGDKYLHTSPEFALKRLLAAGETKIFALGPVWRDEPAGPLHRAEFTMLEWYRAGADYTDVQADALALAALAVQAAGTDALRFAGHSTDPRLPARRLTVAEAFLAFAGVDVLAHLDDPAGLARAAGLALRPDEDFTDVFSRLLVERVEPGLPSLGLVVLDEYPAPEAALARRSPHDSRVAERFELYACGVELANGFGELVDPAEQRARLEAAMADKQRRFGHRWPIDEDFLAALAHCPPASGCALGVDRLAMLATGARSLADVRWTGE